MARKKAGTTSVCQLKITLKGIRPPIWRRVQAPATLTFVGLHAVIQAVFDWTDSHLHQFVAEGAYIGDPEDYEDYGDIDAVDERRALLGDIVDREKQRLLYVYDFGDNWEHEILVEKIISGHAGSERPVCLAGRRQRPPEDCGGPWGYQQFLEAIRDPKDEQHQEMLEWVGGSFDAEAFDLDAANRALAALRLGPLRLQ